MNVPANTLSRESSAASREPGPSDEERPVNGRGKIAPRAGAEALLAAEKKVLELIATGAPLPLVLETLTREIERQSADGMLCSVLLLDESGQKLLHGAGPSLPEVYNRAIDGIAVGPGVGSCGTAAFERQPVCVRDVADDPRWANFKDLAAAHGLGSCCSTPIFSSQGKLLGTIAMYYRRAHDPDAHDWHLIERATHLASIVIEREQTEAALRESESYMRQLVESNPDCVKVLALDGHLISISHAGVKLLELPDASSLLNRNWTEFWSGADRAAAREVLASAANGETTSFQGFCPTATGQPKWWDVVLSPVFNPEGKPKQILAVSRDITERKRSELLLLEQTRLLEMIASGRPLDACLAALCAAVPQLNPRSHACILLADAERRAFRRSITPDLGPAFSEALKDAPINDLCIGTCGEAVFSGKPATCADVAHDERWSKMWRDLCVSEGILAGHFTPIMGVNGLPLGSFFLYFDEARKPNDWELRLAQFGAHVSSLAIERDRGVQAQQRDLADARRLQEISAQLIHADNVAALYQQILDVAAEIMRSDFASMQMFYPERGRAGELRLLAARGFTPEAAKFWEWVRADSQCSCGVALRTGARAIVADVAHCDSMAGTEDQATYLQAGIHAVQSTPLISRSGKLLGMISTHWRAPHQPTERDLRLLDILARQTADLVERKQAEEKLRESEARFRTMSDHCPMMLWVTDPSAHCTHLNQRWYKFTGQTPETALGFGWLEAVHPGDREPSEKIFLAANAKHESFRLEYRLRRHDGEYRWAIDAAAPRFSESGEFLGYIGSVIDIQERKEAEETLRKTRERFDIVKDAAQVGFWFCDLPLEKLNWDDRVKEHFWLPPEAGITIDTFYECLHPDDRERTRRAIEASIVNRTQYDIEYRTVAPDGRCKWIRAIGHTFYDAHHQPIRFDGVTLDITKAKQAEELMKSEAKRLEVLVQQRTARLQESIGELEGFSYTIAHDMRAPLRAMQSFANYLEEDCGEQVGSDGKDYIRRIIASAQRMDRLIQDVLNYSKIARAELELEPVDLSQFVSSILESYPGFQPPMASVRVQGKLPVVLGNEAALTQCLSNLLGNAVKFVRPGVMPEVQIEAQAVEGDRVRLFVRDNGIGIDQQGKTKIFGMFERLSRNYEGTGIGLSIVKKAAERMGGSVGLESAPGQGSTFWIELKRPEPG